MTRQRAKTPEEQLRKADPVLGAIIAASGERPTGLDDPTVPHDRYGLLIRAIVSQNISASAARSIFGRLLARYGGHAPKPQQLLADDPEQLRLAAGLSHAKTAALRSLAEHILAGELELDRLHEFPDEEVVAQLSAVKGIGRWTAEMFLIFHLHRPDVLPVGDLGIRRAVERAYGLEELPGKAELTEIAEPWHPYRTLACLYLWQMAETTPQV